MRRRRRRRRRLPPLKGAGSFPRPVPSLGLHATLLRSVFCLGLVVVKRLPTLQPFFAFFRLPLVERKEIGSIAEPLSREDSAGDSAGAGWSRVYERSGKTRNQQGNTVTNSS